MYASPDETEETFELIHLINGVLQNSDCIGRELMDSVRGVLVVHRERDF